MLDHALEFWQWLRTHPSVLWWSGALSIVMFLGTLVIVPILLVRIPADYFSTSPGENSPRWQDERFALWLAFHASKNLFGVLLVLMGIILLVLPGQGLLTVLLGISLLDLPGKRRLEIALLRRKSVRRAVNWLRQRSARPPLELPANPAPANQS